MTATAASYLHSDFIDFANQQPGENSRSLSSIDYETTQQGQQQNLIMINQVNIIDIHHHVHASPSSSSTSPRTPLMTSMMTTPKIDEDEDDGYFFQQGPPSSSPASSSLSSAASVSSTCSSLADKRDFMSEIDNACRLLAISADPYNWNQTDVRKWLMYQQHLHQLTPMFNKLLDYFHMDGMSLCELNIEDFHQRICNSIGLSNNSNTGSSSTWHCATILYNELNIWRTAITTIEPDLSFFDSEQQPTQSTSSNNNNHNNQNYELPIISRLDPYYSPASSPTSSSYGSVYHHQMFPNHQVDVYHHQQPHQQNNQMIQKYNPSSSVYSSSPSPSPSPCSPAGSSHSSMSPNYSNHHHHQQQQQRSQEQKSSSVNHIVSITNTNNHKFTYPTYQNGPDASGNDVGNGHYVGLLHHQPQPQMMNTLMMQQQQQTSDYGSDGSVLSDDEDLSDDGRWNEQPTRDYLQFNQNYPMMKFNEPLPQQSMTQQINSIPHISSNPRPHGSSSIQLWQFLKELLSQPHLYGNAIRWLERSRGVFKIEDSVRVARLWGERKNRPAMNYDKLSRSIRQYYKKGIMKKTERAQRLVYQFCQPYGL